MHKPVVIPSKAAKPKRPSKKPGNIRTMSPSVVDMPEDRYILPTEVATVSWAKLKSLILQGHQMVAIPSFGMSDVTPGQSYHLHLDGSEVYFHDDGDSYVEIDVEQTEPNGSSFLYLVKLMDWLTHNDPRMAEAHAKLDSMTTDDLIEEIKKAKLILELARPKVRARVEGCT